jgi:hypothetical protein
MVPQQVIQSAAARPHRQPRPTRIIVPCPNVHIVGRTDPLEVTPNICCCDPTHRCLHLIPIPIAQKTSRRPTTHAHHAGHLHVFCAGLSILGQVILAVPMIVLIISSTTALRLYRISWLVKRITLQPCSCKKAVRAASYSS